MNEETTPSPWTIAKRRLRRHFTELTDADLRYTEGEEEKLLRRLERRTGRSRVVVAHLIATAARARRLGRRAR